VIQFADPVDIEIKNVRALIIYPPSPYVGETRSQYIGADDGAVYNVKFQQNEVGARVIANDLIASRIAIAIGVPTPEIALVYVDEIFLEANPKLAKLYPSPVKAGWHFGSKKLENSYPPPDPDIFRMVTNHCFAN
jgi:hypothetical protein